jgi:large subunit ribosomal protein L13
MQTRIPKKAELEERWLVVDAAGKTLGRLATHVATRLRGKHRPTYTPHMDTGDHVIVVNAAQVRVTGQKAQQKLYRRHTGYPGGLREVPFERMLERHPERVIRLAVSGMLPKNRLGRKLIKKLKVYAGPEHPHQAQQPVTEDLAGKA